MTNFETNLLILVLIGLLAGCLTYLIRRFLPWIEKVKPEGWGSTLSYVATAFGVVIGFSILYLFGQYATAKSAVGDEATSIGTAFEQAKLFPGSSDGIQRALVCYSRSVPEYDWPAMRNGGGGAPQVDQAYADLVASLGKGDRPTTGALHSATATNLASQVGSISTAREARLVTAETRVPPMLWLMLYVSAAFVVLLLFAETLSASRGTQSVLMGFSTVFTAVLLLLVIALAQPYGRNAGAVNPKLIEETTASMVKSAPQYAHLDCNFGK